MIRPDGGIELKLVFPQNKHDFINDLICNEIEVTDWEEHANIAMGRTTKEEIIKMFSEKYYSIVEMFRLYGPDDQSKPEYLHPEIIDGIVEAFFKEVNDRYTGMLMSLKRI